MSESNTSRATVVAAVVAVVVAIFVTQTFSFVESQFHAVFGLGVAVVMLAPTRAEMPMMSASCLSPGWTWARRR